MLEEIMKILYDGCEYEYSLYEKGRIKMPLKFKAYFQDNKLYIVRGLNRCLFLFTKDAHETLKSKLKLISKENVNRIFSECCQIKYNRQNQILLPKYLKDYAQINSDIIMIKLANRIEIWAKERWGEYCKKQKISIST
jgi:MraZ protein